MAVTVFIPPAERLTDAIVADFIDVAGLVVETDVLAELAVANLSLWTLGVGRTRLGLSDTTNHRSRVGDEGGRTGTLGSVVNHLTGGAGAAGVTTARVRAPVVDAGVGLGAVRVCSTSDDAHFVEADMAQEAVIIHTASQHAQSLEAALVDGTVLVAGTGGHADAVRTLHWPRAVG